MHHAICDGWGNIEFTNELFEAYSSKVNGSFKGLVPIKNVFKEFVAFEKSILGSKESKEFWRDYLAGSSPSVIPRVSQIQISGRSESRNVSGLPQTNQLHLLAKELHVSMKAVCLSAYLDLWKNLSQSGPPIVGILSNGRTESLSDPLKALGLFWNITPFAFSNFSVQKRDQIVAVQRMLIKIEDHAQFPLDAILEASGHRELFEATFNFNHFHNNVAQNQSGKRIKVTTEITRDRYHYPFNLVVVVNPVDTRLTVRVDHDQSQFDAEATSLLLSDYLRILDQYELLLEGDSKPDVATAA
jgi:hypothetical protein